MADKTSSILAAPFRGYAWPLVAGTLLAIQVALLPFVGPGAGLSTYTKTLYIICFISLLLATAILFLNAVRSRQAIRLFWSFLAVGYGLQTCCLGAWVYYLVIIGRDHPEFWSSAPLLYLHTIFLIAAVASRPHLKLSRHRPYRTTLNLLLLLFFFVFAYALVLFPALYTQFEYSAYVLRAQALYSGENLLLLAVLGAAAIGAQPPWKGIYRQLLGASTLYAFGSLAANLVIASGKMSAGWYTAAYMASAYWLVWIPLLGRELAPQLEQTVQVDTVNPKQISTLAMLAVVAIPIVGVWELFRSDRPYATHVIRLLIVFLALLFLAITAFIGEYFTKRELSSDVGLAHDRLRMAMTSGKSVGWEWDLASGSDRWFGDLQTMFGIPSDIFSGRVEDFFRYLHPDDRNRVSEAMTGARVSHKPYEAEFRVVRQDGMVRWVTARGAFHYASNGDPERMHGMAVDITERKQIEEALRKSEEKFSKAFRQGPMAITLTSAKDYRYLDVNEGFERMSGWRRDEAIGRTPFDLGIWVNPAERREIVEHVQTEGSIRNARLQLRRRDGTEIVGLGSAELIEIDREPCLLSVVTDITEQEKMQERLHESEQRLRAIVGSAMDGIITVDEHQRIVLFNSAAEKMFGCPANDAVGTAIERFIPPRLRSEHEKHLRSFAESGLTKRAMGTLGSLWGVRANGQEFEIEASISRAVAGGQNLFTVIIRDVSERRRAERALRASEERFRRVVENISDAVMVDNVAGRVVFANDRFLELFGFRSEQLANLNLEDYVAPEYHKELRERHQRRMRGEAVATHFEYQGLRTNGARIWVEVDVVPVSDETGKLVGTQSAMRDITKRRRAEEALRESEERYRNLVVSSHDWVWEVDANGVYTYASPQCQEILGYDPEELIGKTPFDLMPAEESRRVATIFSGIAAERKPFRGLENTNLHKDGHVVVLETNGAPIIDEQGRFHGYRGMDRDITARKQAENLVRESEQRFRLVANTAPVLIWMAGIDKLCNYFNQSWLDFTGRPLAAELGNGWTEGVHPEDLATCRHTYTQAFDQRESFKIQYRLRRHDGEYRWVSDIGVPRFNPDGSFAGYIGSCLDITDLKLAEQALSSMGRKLIEAHEEERTWIARELHDDVNQRIALLAIELDRWNQLLPASAADLHDHIHHARQGLLDLSKDVQALSHRLHSSKLEYLGIAAAANSFCKELSDQQKVQVEFIHSNIPHSIPSEISLCLFRVLQEALQNAAKHSGARHFKVELRGGPDEIQLTVSDSGTGFDPQDALRRQGLGLISMQERLGLVSGQLSIDSAPGRGATIHARVPFRAEEYRSAAG